MSDYYPPGVHKLPDDNVYRCDSCGVKSDHEGYRECPSCEEQNLCESCLVCNTCNTAFVECECGSGELVKDNCSDCCSQCYDAEEDEEDNEDE